MNRLYITIILLLFFNFKVLAGELIGIANITDGDTIKILNNSIRLYGVDAPEKKQKCIKNFKEYNCGQVATEALVNQIGGRQVTCKVQDKLDRYKRYIGVCFVEGVNLNKWLVRNGYVVAYRRYSKDYIYDEEYAKINRLGLWSGSFVQPEKWRKLN